MILHISKAYSTIHDSIAMVKGYFFITIGVKKVKEERGLMAYNGGREAEVTKIDKTSAPYKECSMAI